MCNRAKSNARGLTLAEVLIATAVGGLVLWGVIATNLHLSRSGVRITYYAEMDAQVRRALEQLGRDVRVATAVTWNGSSDITLTLPTLAGETTQVTYAWTAAGGGFFAVPGASSAAATARVHLVRGVNALTFARFDRAGNPAATDLATKRIQVSLTLGRAPSTAAAAQDVVSASFTMRNKATQ